MSAFGGKADIANSKLEIDVMHHAGVVHLALTPALCNFLPQIRQPNIGTVALNQSLLSILARASALRARQAHKVAKPQPVALGCRRPFCACVLWVLQCEQTVFATFESCHVKRHTWIKFNQPASSKFSLGSFGSWEY
jgi:hypothetical protein